MGAQQKSVIERVRGCVCGKESVRVWERVLRGSEKMQVERQTLLSYLTDTSRTQDVLLLIYSLSLSLSLSLSMSLLLWVSLSLLLSASLSSQFFSNFELYCKGCAANSFLFVLNFSLSQFPLFFSVHVYICFPSVFLFSFILFSNANFDFFPLSRAS